MKRLYEVFVRVGTEGGAVVPKDGQPLETLGEAIALGKEYLPRCHEVLIIERHVATRLQGLLPPPEEDEEGRGVVQARNFGGSLTMTSDPDQWFWNILARAGKLERERILSSDEAFDEYFKANPLSPEEQKECDAAVERLRARLLKTAKDYVDRDTQEEGLKDE